MGEPKRKVGEERIGEYSKQRGFSNTFESLKEVGGLEVRVRVRIFDVLVISAVVINVVVLVEVGVVAFFDFVIDF